MIVVLVLIHVATCPQAAPLVCPPGTQLQQRDAPEDAVAAVCIDGRGVAQGPWIERNRDESVRRTGSWRDGEPHGVWLTYHEGWVISEMSYDSGQRQGVFFVRSPQTHRIIQSGAYRSNLPDGPWHWFADDGTLVGTSLFSRGTGEMLYFDSGVKFRSVRFRAGEAVEEIRYDRRGVEIGRRVLSEDADRKRMTP